MWQKVNSTAETYSKAVTVDLNYQKRGDKQKNQREMMEKGMKRLGELAGIVGDKMGPMLTKVKDTVLGL